MLLKQWVIGHSEDEQYLYIFRCGKPGEIVIKADDQGFVVDLFSEKDKDESVATTWAFFEELEDASEGSKEDHSQPE